MSYLPSRDRGASAAAENRRAWRAATEPMLPMLVRGLIVFWALATLAALLFG
jgi:hypothetical protein